jgi:hypothetical protein
MKLFMYCLNNVASNAQRRIVQLLNNFERMWREVAEAHFNVLFHHFLRPKKSAETPGLLFLGRDWTRDLPNVGVLTTRPRLSVDSIVYASVLLPFFVAGLLRNVEYTLIWKDWATEGHMWCLCVHSWRTHALLRASCSRVERYWFRCRSRRFSNRIYVWRN